MIVKRKYLVYNPKTDSLDSKKVSTNEWTLIDNILRSPSVKFKSLIESSFEKAANKEEFLDRLDEIFSFYYDAPEDPGIMLNLFHGKKASLEIVFQILEDIRNGWTKKNVLAGKGKSSMHLKDIFYTEDDFERCIKALRDVTPQIVNDENKFILKRKSKQALIAWYDVLKERGKVKNLEDEVLANIFRTFFQMDSFAPRTFRSQKSKTYTEYYPNFKLFIK